MRRLVLKLGAGAIAAAGVVAMVKYSPLPRAASEFSRSAGDALIEGSAALGFRLEALTVEGRGMTAREALMGALDAEYGTPIAAIDVARARSRVEALPWVRSAKVERRLPGTIHVILEERTPYALWQRGPRYTLVDHEGQLIVDVPESDFRLPLIVGTDAPAHAASLFETLQKEPDLARRVHAAVRVGGRRWNLHLDAYEGGISVRLPEEKMPEAWTRLALLEREHGILERDLEFIDLRLEDQLVVRLRKAPADSAPATAGVTETPVVPVKQDL